MKTIGFIIIIIKKMIHIQGKLFFKQNIKTFSSLKYLATKHLLLSQYAETLQVYG